MITYIKLFLEFFHIGLFSFGGGYATLPFLYHIADVQKWYTTKQLADMIAVSSITPGPVGVNVATFAGFMTGSDNFCNFAIIDFNYHNFKIVRSIQA